jgi:hypothetical protein
MVVASVAIEAETAAGMETGTETVAPAKRLGATAVGVTPAVAMRRASMPTRTESDRLLIKGAPLLLRWLTRLAKARALKLTSTRTI